MEVKILIVDDETLLGGMLEDLLSEHGYQSAVAEDGPAALKLMESFKPAIALVDYRLGDTTGLELARLMRKIDPDLPVILMTAYASLDLAVKAIQEDVYDFISKPIDHAFLVRSVAKAIENRKLIEENKLLVRNLKESNATLEKLNQMKSKFLSIVTHDLRTPLTSIRGFNEMLRSEKDLTPEETETCLDNVERAVMRMNGLIVSLMDMVSIESGKLRMELKPVDFLQICRELKGTMAPVAAAKKAQLAWDFPESPMKINGDSNRIVQVMTNLISNAIKHMPENGKVSVKVSVSPREVKVEVTDDGDGISPENQTRIFEQFFQVESSAHKREGLGLGLSIAREIVSAHGGEIGVQSPGLGLGSTFWFTIPLADKS